LLFARSNLLVVGDCFVGKITLLAMTRNMDAEIDALEGKLSKARQVKQGMMSMLLTGRVRLVKV
jgi:type I restriction enzyme S subunit